MGLRLRSIFRPNLPAVLRLAPSSNRPAPPSNLTSDSHRALIPSALPSGLPSARAADLPSGPAWRTIRPTPAVASPPLLRSDLRLAPSTYCFRLDFELDFDSSSARSLRRCPPVNLRLSPPIILPALPADPTVNSSSPHLRRHRLRIIDLRLRYSFRLPSNQSLACAFD